MNDYPPLFNSEPIILGTTIILQLISTFLISLYLIASIIGLIIASLNYQSICKDNYQQLIIIESIISLPLTLYSLYIIYKKKISGCGIIFWIIGFIISSSLIMTGMILIWDNTKGNTNCPNIIYKFSYIYFNLWWILMGIGIIFISIVWIPYNRYMIDVDN
jgi:hypothetical protein